MSVYRQRKKFDCETCQWGRHCDDSNPAPYEKFVIESDFGQIESTICFKPMITARSHFLIGLFQHYQQGNLAHAGGVLEQPALYMAAMKLIEHLANEKPPDD